MSKRFIDTGLFDDEWFMNLSQEGKLLWIYFITKCDHAGILRLNFKLCQVQTGLRDVLTVIKELGNRLVAVSEHLYFIPKFIEYQYPGFPNSKVRQQQSAVDILTKYKLFDKDKLTVNKELAVSDIIVNNALTNTYENDNDNDNCNDNLIEIGNENKADNEQVMKPINIEFEAFWELYDKKVGDKTKLIKKWNHLSNSDRQAIIDYIPKYIKSQPDKMFRKHPETFFNNRSWNDEIIKRNQVSGLDKTLDRIKQLNEQGV